MEDYRHNFIHSLSVQCQKLRHIIDVRYTAVPFEGTKHIDSLTLELDI